MQANKCINWGKGGGGGPLSNLMLKRDQLLILNENKNYYQDYVEKIN